MKGQSQPFYHIALPGCPARHVPTASPPPLPRTPRAPSPSGPIPRTQALSLGYYTTYLLTFLLDKPTAAAYIYLVTRADRTAANHFVPRSPESYMKASKSQAADAAAYLRKLLRPGRTVYTVLRHASRSGMMRSIDLFVIVPPRDGCPADIRCITGSVAAVLGYPTDRSNGGLRVGGCGMDMGFHVVYSLGRALWPQGFKLARNQHGRNGDTSGRDNDGGYALNHRWL